MCRYRAWRAPPRARSGPRSSALRRCAHGLSKASATGGEPAGREAIRREGPAARLEPSPSEDPLIDLGALIRDNLTAVVIVLAALLAFALVAIVWLARRQAALQRRLAAITRGAEGDSLEAVLERHLERVHQVARTVESLGTRTAALEHDGRFAFQKVGLVRYNPFEDTGGNQSFAIALLDANDDGIIVSSLHARGGTRIYAKALTAGRSDAALSDEEAQALRIARAGGPAQDRRAT